MKIKINKEIVARGKLDFKKFKNLLKKDLDLEKAFYESIKIEETRINNIDNVIRTLFLFTDWGNILYLQNDRPLDVVELVIYECEVFDFPTYKFRLVDTEKGEIELKRAENVEEKQIYFMVFPTFNPTFEKHIEHMLSQNLISWGEKPDWSYLVDLT